MNDIDDHKQEPEALESVPERSKAASISIPPRSEQVYVSNCCRKGSAGQISKSLLRFLTTVFFTTLLLGFAMFKLSGQEVSPDEKAIYFSLLSSCVAAYMPAPSPHDYEPSIPSSRVPVEY
jgi:hypothetical protein